MTTQIQTQTPRPRMSFFRFFDGAEIFKPENYYCAVAVFKKAKDSSALKVLIVESNRPPKNSEDGVSHKSFGLPGGGNKPDDSKNPLITALRELYEETGIELKSKDLTLIGYQQEINDDSETSNAGFCKFLFGCFVDIDDGFLKDEWLVQIPDRFIVRAFWFPASEIYFANHIPHPENFKISHIRLLDIAVGASSVFSQSVKHLQLIYQKHCLFVKS